jgi:hypothetical protein
METYHGMELKPALKGYRVPEELQKVLLALATVCFMGSLWHFPYWTP